MRNGLRGAFRALTIGLFGLSVWTAYANVFSDDAAIRTRAGEVARKFAGCGDGCKVTGMNGQRGMLEERIDYDIDGRGRVSVACRREFIAFGNHDCNVEK